MQYRDVLDTLVLELVDKETLAKDDLERILAPVRKRPPHNTFAGFGKRTPSDQPPVEIPPSLRKPASTAPAPATATATPSATPPNGAGTTNGVNAPTQPVPQAPVGPQSPQQPGAFGPTTHSGSSRPYGGYAPPPPAPYDHPGPHSGASGGGRQDPA
jgi:cell division protease FtsH